MSKQPQGVSFHLSFKLIILRSRPYCQSALPLFDRRKWYEKTQNQNPKNQKDTFKWVGSVGKKLLQVSLQWLFAKRKHKINYGTKTIPFKINIPLFLYHNGSDFMLNSLPHFFLA